ncbi:lipid-transfer protein [Sphingomonas sp.]|uniref:lipid-transfer protein n=1 Tax=Sphingomonas sp. TaxID=28214 RepID=UPI003AFFFF5F
MTNFVGRTAIAGVGATAFSKNSGVSELQLVIEAIMAAVADAGLELDEVDGLVTFDLETNTQIEVAHALGLKDVRFFSVTPFGGGGACAVVMHAALAVASGVAETVVCYRAFNERSGQRFGTGQTLPPPGPHPSSKEVSWSWGAPHGLLTPAALVAMVAQRYCYEHGVTSEDFGRVSVIDRANAATNPKAWFHDRPITLADHQASPWIVEPLHLLDCCQESDGGVALVVTSVERARKRGGRTAVIKAAAQGLGPQQGLMVSYSREYLTRMPEIGIVARQLWAQSGLTHDDIDVLMLYDHFTPYVLIQLEELGFCGYGEAAMLLASGALNLDGRWPLNPNGGLLGEAYIHGFNTVAEGVRQVRGEAVNQVKDAANVIVTAGTGIPTSGMILGVE